MHAVRKIEDQLKENAAIVRLKNDVLHVLNQSID